MGLNLKSLEPENKSAAIRIRVFYVALLIDVWWLFIKHLYREKVRGEKMSFTGFTDGQLFEINVWF